MSFCVAYEISFKVESSQRVYKHGWGHNGLAPQLIIATWTLMAQDTNNKSVKLIFALRDDALSLIIGFDARQHSTRTYSGSREEIRFCPQRLVNPIHSTYTFAI